MSEKNIGKKFDAQINYGWGLSLNMTGKAPAINKRIFDTLSDAQSFADDYNDSAIEGLVLSVVTDDNEKNNGIYFVERIKKSADDKPSSLIKVGYNEEKYAVETYDDALELATIDNIGKVIYVKNNYYDEDSESEVVEYEAAPYIIVGEKSLAKLSTSSISFENEIAELKTKITSTEENIYELERVIGNLENDFIDVKQNINDSVNNLKSDIVDLQSVKDEHTISIKDLNDSIESLNLKVENIINADSDSDDNDNLEIFNEINQQLNNLSKEDENIKNEINNLDRKLKWLDYNL